MGSHSTRLRYVFPCMHYTLQNADCRTHFVEAEVQVSDATNDSESTTMFRLHILRFKTGSARQQQYAGKQRRIVNLHNAVTVGR
jgi:hypothetical protein